MDLNSHFWILTRTFELLERFFFKLKNVIESFEMKLNSKDRTEIIKTKNQNRNMKSQNSERRKPSFTNRICRKYRLIWTRTEQNNDHTRIIHKIQFHSSFKTSLNVYFWMDNELLNSVQSLASLSIFTCPNYEICLKLTIKASEQRQYC